jgi:prohibitin 1
VADAAGQAEQERQAAVIRAEGEGEAATIISKALDKAGEGLVAIRRIEASKDIAATLVSAFAHVRSFADVAAQSKSPNVTFLPSSGNGMLLNVNTK